MKTLRRLSLALLLALPGAAAPPPAEPPTVYISDLRVALDEKSFNIVRNDPFVLNELSANDTGAPGFGKITAGSKRICVRGRSTTVEILGPGNDQGLEPGESELRFVVEKKGELETVEARLRQSFGDRVSRATEEAPGPHGKPVPLRTLVSVSGRKDANFSAQIFEYPGALFRALWPDKPGPSGGVTRADVTGARYRKGSCMEDVESVMVALDAPERDLLLKSLGAYGWTTSLEGGTKLVAKGPDFSIHVSRPLIGNPTGIVYLEMILNPECVMPAKQNVGDITRLVPSGAGRARWIF